MADKTSTLAGVQPPTSVCQRGSILLKSLAEQEPAPTVPSGLLALIRGVIHYPPAEYTLKVRYDPHDRSWVGVVVRAQGVGRPVPGRDRLRTFRGRPLA